MNQKKVEMHLESHPKPAEVYYGIYINEENNTAWIDGCDCWALGGMTPCPFCGTDLREL
jgi:hypothetical protein